MIYLYVKRDTFKDDVGQIIFMLNQLYQDESFSRALIEIDNQMETQNAPKEMQTKELRLDARKHEASKMLARRTGKDVKN